MVTIPLPRSSNEVGSGTGGGVGEQFTQNTLISTLGLGLGFGVQLTQNTLGLGNGVGVGVAHSGHSLCVHTPVRQTNGISAKNGQMGMPPPFGAEISPQSQMVPYTVSCENT